MEIMRSIVPGLDPEVEEGMTQVTHLDKFIESKSTFSCRHQSSKFIEMSVGLILTPEALVQSQCCTLPIDK